MRKMLLSALTCLAATAAIGEEPAPAECPQFIGPLPNVIITDFNSAGVADTPANFFVFVDAFDLYDYIDLGSTGLTDATFAFNEFVKGSSVPSTGDMRIYSINGELGAPAVPTTPAEIDAASVDSGGTIAAEGILGLRNVKLSAVGESTFPAPNGDDVTSPGNTRTITIYIIAPSSSGACYQFGSIDVRSFDAITELGSVDSSDRLEEAGCTFVPFVDYPTFDSGWNFGKLHADFTSIPASLVEPGTISGYNGSPPAGTQTIGIASAAELDNTFAVWRRNLGVPLEGETIYRIRSLVNSNATVNQSNWARIRFGGDFLGENGQGEQGYTANASSMPTTPRMQNFLHWVKRSSAGNSLPGSSDQPAYNFDLIDEVQSTGSTLR